MLLNRVLFSIIVLILISVGCSKSTNNEITQKQNFQKPNVNKRDNYIKKIKEVEKAHKILEESQEQKTNKKEYDVNFKDFGAPNKKHIYFIKNGNSVQLEFTMATQTWDLINKEPIICTNLSLLRNDFEELGLDISDAYSELDSINDKYIIRVSIDVSVSDDFTYKEGKVKYEATCEDEHNIIMFFRIRVQKSIGGVKIIGPYYDPPEL